MGEKMVLLILKMNINKHKQFIIHFRNTSFTQKSFYVDLRTFSSPHCESKINGKINIFIIYNPVIAHFIVKVMHHVPVFDENNHSQFNDPVLASASRHVRFSYFQF